MNRRFVRGLLLAALLVLLCTQVFAAQETLAAPVSYTHLTLPTSDLV